MAGRSTTAPRAAKYAFVNLNPNFCRDSPNNFAEFKQKPSVSQEFQCENSFQVCNIQKEVSRAASEVYFRCSWRSLSSTTAPSKPSLDMAYAAIATQKRPEKMCRESHVGESKPWSKHQTVSGGVVPGAKWQNCTVVGGCSSSSSSSSYSSRFLVSCRPQVQTRKGGSAWFASRV